MRPSIEVLKTGALFVQSVLRANGKYPLVTYWDECPQAEFDTLIKTHFVNPLEPERAVIRETLKEQNIQSVLDVGCGTGTEYRSYTSDPQLQNVKYVGVDRSVRMIYVAKNRAPEGIFVQGDLNALPFDDNTFDAVVLKHVLEHQPDGYIQAVQEAVRVAKMCVLVDFFHTPLPIVPDIYQTDRQGYANNWYNKGRFENFLDTLPLKRWDVQPITSSRGQRGAIYILFI